VKEAANPRLGEKTSEKRGKSSEQEISKNLKPLYNLLTAIKTTYGSKKAIA